MPNTWQQRTWKSGDLELRLNHMKALFDFRGLGKACFDRGGDSGILEK